MCTCMCTLPLPTTAHCLQGSIDGTQRLVIRGKYVPKYIESLLRKYIVEYVTCQVRACVGWRTGVDTTFL